MKNNKKLKPEFINLILSLFSKENKTIKQIAEQLNISTVTVRKYLKENNLIQPKVPKYTQEQMRELAPELAKKYNSGTSLSQLSREYGVTGTTIGKYIRELGEEVYNKHNYISYDIEEDIVPLVQQGMSLTKIAQKFSTSRNTLSKKLKELGYEVINHQNETKFNDKIFDKIDTEEKAYWLGFIYADGYIDSSPLDPNKKSKYQFELSLKESDVKHLYKFNSFMQHNKNNIKIGKVNLNDKTFFRCRWNVANKHLWETLNNYGCTPQKSLTLQFPEESVFKDKSLIRHFIRGYIDGDGCISHICSNSSKTHLSPIISVLGTKEFLQKLQQLLGVTGCMRLNNDSNQVTYALQFSSNISRYLCSLLYDNCTIYLDRKYSRAQFFKTKNCRSVEEFTELLQTENGESCDANPVVTEEIKESSAPYSVGTEPEKSE